MLRLLYYAIGILVLHSRETLSNPATYDQRQTGDLNVQIHLKDVEVVALLDSELLDDYTQDYDYSYDYGDFTIKPISKPTSSPISTSSVQPWVTWPTNPSTLTTTTSSPNVQADSTTSKNPEEQSAAAATNSSIPGSEEEAITVDPSGAQTASNETEIKLQTDDKAVDESFGDSTVDKIEAEDQSSVAAIKPSSKKQCPSGYTLTKKGRCGAIQSRRRISFLPLMKLGSRFSQKGRFGMRKDLPVSLHRSEAEH